MLLPSLGASLLLAVAVAGSSVPTAIGQADISFATVDGGCPSAPPCCEEDCCGLGTRWNPPFCVNDSSSLGFNGTHSSAWDPGCVSLTTLHPSARATSTHTIHVMSKMESTAPAWTAVTAA